MPSTQGPFPATRFRRTRASAALRDLVRETELSVNDLIWPVFIREGEGWRSRSRPCPA
jgi:porphobilinogen synthase